MRPKRNVVVMLAAFALGALVTAAVGTLSLQTRALQSLEYWSGDWRSALLADRAPTQHPRVAVVLVDDDTVFGLPYRSPIDRSLLARLVKVIDAAGASVIGLDFLFDQATEQAKDSQLLDAMRQAKARIVLGSVDGRIPLRQERRDFLSRFLDDAGAITGYLNLRYEIDGVVRAEAEPDEKAGAGAGRDSRDGFAAAIANVAGAKTERDFRRIAWLGKPQEDAETFLIVPAGPLLAAAPDSTASVGEHRLAQMLMAQLKGRVVLIGGDLPDHTDRHPTPLSKLSGEPMPGVVIHAHLVAQFLDGRRLYHVRPAVELTLLLALSIGGVLLGSRYHRSAVTMGSAPMLLLAAVDAIIFTQLRTIMPFAAAALAWLGGVICGRSLGWIVRRRAP